VLAPELREKAEELIGRYPVPRSALLPLLHLVQYQDGYITDDGIAECAELLGLTKAEVQAVSTFYSMYKREPLGRHLVSVCTNFSCQVRGASEVFEKLSSRFGVGHNQTTEDGDITLEHAECLGNCEGAPVVTVDYLNYECVAPDAAVMLVEKVIAGDIPPPTRGMLPPGVREVEYRLAGLGPLEPARPGVIPHQARATDAAVPANVSGPGVEPVHLDARRGRPDVETPATEADQVEERHDEPGYPMGSGEPQGGEGNR
jgi:NADH-quinone oxidoreductase subunit E